MIDILTAAFANFAFLRPWWLAALALLPLLVLAQRRRLRAADGWQHAVDPHLLPHLLQGAETRGSRGASTLMALGLTLSVLALAGPSWRLAPAPLWQVEAPLMIALDLSWTMTATDLVPNRLTQARAKIRTLLEKRRGGQVGLLVFADDAFTVAPITRDAKTVQAMLDSLSPDLMPVDGQRVDRAITQASNMLTDAGFKRGEILVVSDHADGSAQLAATRALGLGFRVSALGIGTLAGSPIANKNGFVTDSTGQVQLARLDPASLDGLASAGGGRYVGLAVDDSDLSALGVLDANGRAQAGEGDAKESATAGTAQRVDDGYWLLLGVLPLALLGFRRGWLAVLWLAQIGGVFVLTALSPGPAWAADSPVQGEIEASGQGPDPQGTASAAGELWSRLWKRDDQRAREALERGDTERARELAPDSDLRASAAYRGEDYAAAAEGWASQDHADAHYNRGNALAREGKLEDAIGAYDQALERAPGMEDAIANKKAVEDLLKQQQQQKQDGEKQDGEKSDGEKSDGEKQDGDKQDGKQQDGKQQDEKSGEQQQDGEGEPKDGEQKDGEQKDSEKKDGEQKDGEEPKAGDAKEPSAAELAERQAAEEAARKEMQEALERAGQAGAESKDGTEDAPPAVIESAEERAQSEQKQAIQQWLRRVPDDPGGLLRQKFLREYQRRRQEQGEERR